MTEQVDVIVLSRDASDLPEAVRRGIAAQRGVRLNVHRVIGTPRAEDSNAWTTIVRARNAGKRLGSAPWVLYLDDDVILGPGCVSRLVEASRSKPQFAALAADYLGEMAGSTGSWDHPRHVAMGATLFRRDRLALLNFRWQPGKCECRCACDDLRRAGFGIGYLPGAEARHQPIKRSPAAPAHHEDPEPRSPATAATSTTPNLPGRVLSAFNRRHFPRFRRQFLGSLRASGNTEPVTAVAFGLYPSERRILAGLAGVEVVSIPTNGVHPAVRRLREFQQVLDRWPDETPVAYWDAGDVFFQARLAPLWDLVRSAPEKLLAVREPIAYPENIAIVDWTETITDLESRRRAFEIFSTHPFLNSGFVAGTARTLGRYLREGERLLNSPSLLGTGDWGDQTALNLYCHTNSGVWQELPAGWNYCLFGRTRKDYRIGTQGQVESLDGAPVYAVHGNARRLRHTELSYTI
ncbi:MAG TPA: glycosyltransferase family 2 protein [Isosphaeraceae bacterium]|jgi:hypothetical protein|nr:glycosyltransferase family 2 protein [Isosphaeraceae bacterium]